MLSLTFILPPLVAVPPLLGETLDLIKYYHIFFVLWSCISSSFYSQIPRKSSLLCAASTSFPFLLSGLHTGFSPHHSTWNSYILCLAGYFLFSGISWCHSLLVLLLSAISSHCPLLDHHTYFLPPVSVPLKGWELSSLFHYNLSLGYLISYLGFSCHPYPSCPSLQPQSHLKFLTLIHSTYSVSC